MYYLDLHVAVFLIENALCEDKHDKRNSVVIIHNLIPELPCCCRVLGLKVWYVLLFYPINVNSINIYSDCKGRM